MNNLKCMVIFGIFLSSCTLMKGSQKITEKEANLKPTKIILDSDSAIFWDDGAALAMLLQHPKKVEILGITVVLGNHWPHQGAEYLARVLKVANRADIPIYLGEDTPLKNSKRKMLELERNLIQENIISHQGFWKGAYSRLKEVKSLKEVEPAKDEQLSGILPQNKDAVNYIIDTLNNSQEEITFVAIGPLTNLAKALQKDKGIEKKIKRILLMGGNIHVKGNTTPDAELNFLFDPEAAQIVLSSDIPEKLMFPLDICLQALIDHDRYHELISIETPYTNFLKSDRGPKFKNSSYSVPSWDTALAAYMIDPTTVISSKNLPLKVIEIFGPRYGVVEINEKEGNKIQVMTKIDKEKYFSILKDSLTRKFKDH